MPDVSTTPLQSTFDSGYYETDYIKQEPDYDESMGSSTAVLPPKIDTGLNLNNFDQDIEGHTHTKYCPVHGCDTTRDTFETICEDNANEAPLEDPVNVTVEPMNPDCHLSFPSSTDVCGTHEPSALTSFNPLQNSEPNLDLCDAKNMTDENEPGLSTTDMICDVKTETWSVNIHKLSMEEIDFLSGPKLLPTLTEPIPSVETDIANPMPPPPPPLPPAPQALDTNEPLMSERPHRATTTGVNYADHCTEEEDGEEYIPPKDEEVGNSLEVDNQNKHDGSKRESQASSECDENIPLSKLLKPKETTETVDKTSSPDEDDLPLSTLRTKLVKQNKTDQPVRHLSVPYVRL